VYEVDVEARTVTVVERYFNRDGLLILENRWVDDTLQVDWTPGGADVRWVE
jgi:hypothetical protein